MSNIIQTNKFGELDFDNPGYFSEVKTYYDDNNLNATKTTSLLFSFNDKGYFFIPQNIVEKGFVKDNKQFYNPNFLKNFDDIQQVGEFVDLKNTKYANDLEKNSLSTKGVLVPGPYSIQKGLVSSLIGNNYLKTELNAPSSDGRFRVNDISGIGKVGDEYVYIANTQNVGNTTASSAYYDAYGEGSGQVQWKEKDKFGFVGSLARGITGAIAAVPFLPEIVGIATGNPYLYGSLKSAQTAGQGGDVGDVIKTGLLATGGALAGQQLASAFSGAEAVGTASVGGTPGVSEVYPVYSVPAPIETVIAPGVSLPPVDLFGNATFPQQGFKVPSINSSEVALIPQGTALPGQGLIAPTLPSVGSMGGGQGLSVGVPGGTITQSGLTPTGAVPVLGDASSFINNPDVLGQAVISPETSGISLQQALRGARLANQLMNPPEQPGMPMGGIDQGGGGMQPQGVDYSGLLGLLQSRVGVPGISSLLSPAQIRYPSLLG